MVTVLVLHWTRDAHEIYQVPRAIQAGRVWINQYHSYPAGYFGATNNLDCGRKPQNDAGHYRQAKIYGLCL
jgi:aldehyde dehydrogenase